jgi:hypothetical protein
VAVVMVSLLCEVAGWWFVATRLVRWETRRRQRLDDRVFSSVAAKKKENV